MAAKKTIRLFKIASDINIGKDAIIEFLNSKGFDIQNKPTAVLTEEMVDAVYDKFKKEKQAIEKQREKLEKHKKVRKPATDKEEAGAQEAAAESDDKIREDAETNRQPMEIDVEASEEILPDKKDKPEKSSEITVSKDITDVNTQAGAGVIALHDRQKDMRDGGKVSVETMKLEKEQAAKKKEYEKIGLESLGKIVKKKEPGDEKEEADINAGQSGPGHSAMTNKSARGIKEGDETHVEADNIAILRPEAADGDKEAISVAVDGTVVVDAIEIDEELERTEELEEKLLKTKKKEKIGKKRKKRKKIAEVELDEDGKTPQLRGLTIVGKIDLRQDKEKVVLKDRKIKKKPVQESEEDVPLSKKTRKRKKSKVKILEIEQPAILAPGKKTDKKRKRKKTVREMIKDEDVDAAIKKTLAGMETSAAGASLRAKMRQKKKAEREEKELKKIEENEKDALVMELTEFVTTSDLASLMQVSANEIIMKCMELGLMVSINQRLDKDTIALIADDYGFHVEFLDEKAVQALDDSEEETENMLPRPPIVTIMGHVDHGKTSLLDYIRHSNVVAGEAGGITQHIGAYRVELGNDKYITFLDTPGHEAFTAMRARGAQVTDLVILVVAADDSVMPQTIEAISHAQAAKVPIVVAINKIDKPDAHPDRIRQQLADQNVLVEDWGGSYQSVEISAKAGINIDLLLEKILLEAELLELKANPERLARATVVEANMDKGLGSMATVIVQKGTLKIGDPFIAGIHSGKIRAMFDERGRKVLEAGPSMPVRAIGFDGLPEAGDILAVVHNDAEAKVAANQRSQLKRAQEFRQVRHVTLDDISQQIQVGGIKDLNLIIKADVSGSVEALSDSLLKLSGEEVRVNILHKGVGSITESDVMLAAASSAVIVGFHVSPTAKARKVAEIEKVDIRLYSIIYDCINEIRLALEGLLTPDTEEEILATIEIRRIFRISKTGVIAGCYALSGKIHRNDRVRVLRDGLPVFRGAIHSLKREKDDVREVDAGYECGIMLEGFNDIEEGDIIEAYKVVEIKRTL